MRGCAGTGPNGGSEQNREQDASCSPEVVHWSDELLWSAV